MLVLSRRKDESLCIGSNIVVRVVEIRGGRVKLAIEAPPEVIVHRGEVHHRLQQCDEPAALTLSPQLPARLDDTSTPASTGA